ncbi:DUF6371 domain-containing protein, partial [Winogradskyella sp.]|nr:DUF6371 domain-containing protein [Winogradskyella sp.]
MKKYRYRLDETSKKYRCPSCNKKRFVRYIDNETNQLTDEQYGRCDREIECRYFLSPKDGSLSSDIAFTPLPPKEPSFIEPHLVNLTMKQYDVNPFVNFLFSRYEDKVVMDLINKYKIGTSKLFDGSVVFWQIDNHGYVRSGKIMKYDNKTGKRSKQISWVHSQINKPHFELNQCLFGLHLVTDEIKKIAIVESEKTAILFSIERPDYVWLATGSLTNFKPNLLEPIKGKVIKAFPDKGGFKKWNKVASDCNNKGFKIEVSRILEREDVKSGNDIADY